MATVAQKAVTLSEFVEEAIFNSRVSKAIELVEMAKRALGDNLWNYYSSFAASQSTIGTLVDCIAKAAKKHFSKMEANERAIFLRQMLEFFDELQEKAQKIGEPIDVAGIIRTYNL